jgi:hypothetical protein
LRAPSEEPSGTRHSGPLAPPPVPAPAPVKLSPLRQIVVDLSHHARQQLLLGTLLGILPSPALLVLGHQIGEGAVGLFLCILVPGTLASVPLTRKSTWRFLGYGLMWGWVIGVMLACVLVTALAPSACNATPYIRGCQPAAIP